MTLRQNGAQPTTLYFLFGHLFHALGQGSAGDDAVIEALGWAGGDFDFDAKAKLPADESVRSSIPELLERAGPVLAAPVPNAEPAQVRAADAGPPPEPPAAPVEPEPEPPPEAAGPARAEPAAAESRPEPPLRPPAAPPPAPPEPRRGLKFRPLPRHGREPVPVPAGQVMYDSLKTSFVDFPRLITTLEREGYTGYVRLLTDSASGLIYFHEGTALECVYDAGRDPVELGKQALLQFNQEVNRGQGVLDVVGLSPDLVDGLYELTVAQPIYTELYASWVDMNSLLAFLEERKLTGSLMVRAAAGTGVIILDEGKLAGAYTSESREVSEDAGGVLGLCKDPTAMIEVKAAAEGTHEPLDVADVVGPRPAAPPSWSAPPAPPPPAPPPAPRSAVSPPAVPQPEPAPSYVPPAVPAGPAAAPAAVPEGADFERILADLQQMTDDALGNRSRKVKDVLASADHTPAGLESAINQIPGISILFVDASRLETLANDLRAKLQSYLA